MTTARARWIRPEPLEGTVVRLEPLSESHVTGLQEAVRDGELWKLWYTVVPKPGDMASYVRSSLDTPLDPECTPFSVISKGSERIVGCTRYLNVDPGNRRLEIGGTWYAKSVQRTAVNTECKLLLLTHAFERLGANAVEFRTHWMNQASRTAIERLGAKQDGVLRNHRIMPDGALRDTVVFSIINSEWPAARQNLLWRLDHGHCASSKGA